MIDNKELWTTSNGDFNGYCLFKHDDSIEFRMYDMGLEIENIVIGFSGEKIDERKIVLKLSDLDLDNFLIRNSDAYNYIMKVDKQQRWSDLIDIIDLSLPEWLSKEDAFKAVWAYKRKKNIELDMYLNDSDMVSLYLMQEKLAKNVIEDNRLPKEIKYIGGVDVAYNEADQRMVGAIVVIDAVSLEIVDSVWHEMDITFPYIPGLFSFREIPPILEAFKKLEIRPELLICDGQGIAHPKGVGMATHLGIELDIPTIGCAKKRLIGMYEQKKLGSERGCIENLIWDNKVVGVALRTQDNIKPMFVSIGHKISLDTSIKWVLKMCSQFRLPETTRQADQLVNRIMKEQTEIDFMSDNITPDIE